MAKIVLTTESGSDMSKEEGNRLGVVVVPMHLTMGDKEYDDGDISVDEVYKYFDKTGTIPKTSGCTPDDFNRAFDGIREKYPDAQILHIAYSASTTVSYDSAAIAARGRDYVRLFNTELVSLGLRAVVLQVLDIINNEPNITIDELVERMPTITSNTKMCFLPRDLKYIRAGGRCSNMVYLASQILHIHPCIELLGGKLMVTKRYHGRFKKIIPQLIKKYTEENNLSKKRLWFGWSTGLSDELKEIAENAAKECGYPDVEWGQVGCVIGTHAGTSVFGIAGIRDTQTKD